jgi:lactate dehydrogenase-like 2-hydroxyacid dehydrogenase
MLSAAAKHRAIDNRSLIREPSLLGRDSGRFHLRPDNEVNLLHAGNATTFLLYGRPVGFIGFGSIARCLRTLLAPFGCSISVWIRIGRIRMGGPR